MRHTHPGALSVPELVEVARQVSLAGYVLEGTLTLEHEGRPTTAYKAGEAFYVDAGKFYVGMNNGAIPLKFIATLVVEKDKPPSSPFPPFIVRRPVNSRRKLESLTSMARGYSQHTV